MTYKVDYSVAGTLSNSLMSLNIQIYFYLNTWA